MQAVDFLYDNQYLSDYGFVICDFDSNGGVVTADTGSVISFNKTPQYNGKRHGLVYTKYDNCITSEFDICKDPCRFEGKMEISEDEYRNIVRWLNRREFHWFSPVDNADGDEFVAAYYHGSFNVSKVLVDGVLYGIHLTLDTDSPFGFGAEYNIKFEFTRTGSLVNAFYIDDESDEIGYIYPDIEVTMTEDGDMSISNNLTGCNCVVKNCKNGETITINGTTGIITSSLSNHDIANDFNYDYFSVCNTLHTRENLISSGATCKITVTYRPVIKSIV